MILNGQAAIVTGASRGIGRAVALALARAGARVVVNYASGEEAARAVAREIEAGGGGARVVRADVRDLEAVRAMVSEARAAFGRVDILVNNAGIARDNLLALMKADEWKDVLDVDLTGAFHCIKAVSKDMARQRRGRIVNIASAAGVIGDLRRANYSAAKAGLIGLTKAAAREMAASGVTVNAVAPGLIATDLLAAVPEATRARQLARVPLGRVGTPEDVAAAVLFLASDAARYVTGEVLCVDGGMCM